LKVHMRLDLPPGVDALWKGLTPSVRNQVRKGQKGEFTVGWGAHALLDEFYDVFSINMRDLGTPVFGRRLFRVILEQFPGAAELCVVRDGRRAVAGALLLHGSGITEVPSASTLRTYNKSCANMLLYWHLLARAVERGQEAFDFGRSSPESGSHHFKKQWGARASNACWQFLVRRGEIASVQRENPRFVYLIRLWKRLPMRLSQTLGPLLARSIP
jgi:FemAB-related protein (PEP-CTERM system-associated)